MRIAEVFVQEELAGTLAETDKKRYVFTYIEKYSGPPVSLTMPPSTKEYEFYVFPPFFEGLLPEGIQLDSLLKREKIDKNDYFSQLLTVGQDLVGDVTVLAQKGDKT